MKYSFAHFNFNVKNLKESMTFYDRALGLRETRRIEAKDGSFTIVYLGDGATGFKLELTELHAREAPYDLGDNEIHLAMAVDDMAAAKRQHADMGCICYENPEMGIYFIEDPDGYWIEIVPAR